MKVAGALLLLRRVLLCGTELRRCGANAVMEARQFASWRCGSFHGCHCGANMVAAEWRWLVRCCSGCGEGVICCNGVECLLAVVGNAEKMVMARRRKMVALSRCKFRRSAKCCCGEGATRCSWWLMEMTTRMEEDGGGAVRRCVCCRIVVVADEDGGAVAGEIGGGGCVEGGRETRVRVSCVRWRR